jgi:hypothetical protein
MSFTYKKINCIVIDSVDQKKIRLFHWPQVLKSIDESYLL